MLDRALVRSVVGIPYVEDGMDLVKDGGLNCWGLVRHVMLGIGRHDFPRYEQYVERCSTWLLRGLDSFCTDFVPVIVPEPGDFVALKVPGEGEWHIGIMIDNITFLHTSRKTGAQIGRINHPVFRRVIKGYYRWIG